MPALVDPAFEARWSAWLARGVVRDIAVRRRLRIAVPLLAALVATAVYLLNQ
jgi:hypothetical protein